MKRFKLSTEVLFSEDAIDALLEEKDENAEIGRASCRERV